MPNPSFKPQLNSERANARSESRCDSEFPSRLCPAKAETKRCSITAWNNLDSYFKQELKTLVRAGLNAVEVHLDDNARVVTTAIRRKSA